MNSAKKIIYILLFIILGILLQQVFHAILELAVINFLLGDYDRYGLGLSWETWFKIHHIGSILLLLVGVAFGWWQGVNWWRILYIEKHSIIHKSFRHSR